MTTEPEYGAVEYLCYEVVCQMEDRGRDVPETAFNKLCSLVYEEVGRFHHIKRTGVRFYLIR